MGMVPGTGQAASLRSPVFAVAPDFFVIVAQDHSELFPRIRRQFLDDPRVQVILDRRRWERGRTARTPLPDRRWADRRRAPDYWEDLRHHPVVLVSTARRAPVDPAVRSSPASPTAGGRLETTQDVTPMRREIDQLCQWVRSGQELL